MSDHNAEIERVAELLADAFAAREPVEALCRDLMAAVRAKREAERPKPLTTEEAGEIVSRFFDGAIIGPVAKKAHQAVLDAAHERACRVIETLPRHRAYTPNKLDAVRLDDIRAALGVKS